MPTTLPAPTILATPAAPPPAIERLEAAMLDAPPIPLRFVHHFAAGIYAREMIAPPGALILGHAHRADCINIVLAGRARVRIGVDGDVREVQAGDVFLSPAGARKVGLVLGDEPLRFLNVHPNPTDTRDLDALEAACVVHSETYRQHAALEAVELRALEEDPR